MGSTFFGFQIFDRQKFKFSGRRRLGRVGAEISDPNIMKKYATKPDQDTLDMVNLAPTQKEASLHSFSHMGSDVKLYLLLAIMDSVSNYVVNQSSCPVTVVKHGSA
ncbi:putative rossmann-like alpha/beta/alpha sandwich protein [Helianthus anomalus]